MIISVEVPERYNAVTTFVDSHVEAGRGDRVAILFRDQVITYREVWEMVNRTGNALQDLGVEMEDRVLLLLLDRPEFVYCFFGAMKFGAVPIPTNTMLRPADYEYLLNDSRAKVLVVDSTLVDQVEPIRRNLKYLRRIVVVGEPVPEEKGYISYNVLVRGASPELSPADTSKDDAAFWLYSSGTTGFPKGAVHLHHDMIYCADLYARNILGINERDRTFSVAKLFFAYGLGNALYFPFRVGASTVLLPDRPLPETVFATVDRYKPTLFFGVPTAYANMLQVKDAEKKYDFSSVRLCVSAGEALPAAVYTRWKERFGVEILDGIGSTEILHIFISNRPGQVRPGSSGQLVPGYEAKIVDEAGREVGPGEEGTLLIRGDSVAAYYWNKHEKTKETMLGSWINTGDTYIRDEDGFFWYQGRSDDMIKAGGIWVSPAEVESALMEHEAVLECGVVGAPDQEGLLKPLAFVVLKQGYAPSPKLAEELQAFVKNRIAPYKYPRWIRFVDSLPKTATGKIQRFRLRQMLEQERSRAG